MMTPDFLSEIYGAVESDVGIIADELMETIIKRFLATMEAYGKYELIPATLHDILKLEGAGLLYADIQKEIIRRQPQIQKEVKKAFKLGIKQLDVYDKATIKSPYTDLEKQKSINSINRTLKGSKSSNKSIQDIIEKAYQSTQNEVANYTKTTATTTQREFIKLCDKTYMKVQSGESLNRAVLESIEEAGEKGINMVSYPTGHQDKLEVAVARAVRTGINQANARTNLQKCADMGIQIVKVSSHMGARVTKKNDYTNHSWWQGKIYSINWDDPLLAQYKGKNTKTDKTYPDLIKTCGYGTIEGLCGINCRHTFSIASKYTEPDRINQKKNAERYEQQQTQRAMERRIRKLKRIIKAMNSIPNKTEDEYNKIDGLNGRLKKQMEAYWAFVDKHNLPKAEWRRTIT